MIIPIGDLSKRITEQLQDLLPEGIGVDADASGSIRIRSAKTQATVEISLASVTSDAGYKGDYAQALTYAGRSLLSTIQDFVVEELARPWPSAGGAINRDIALPDAAVLGGTLCLWYGDRNAPAAPMIRVPLT